MSDNKLDKDLQAATEDDKTQGNDARSLVSIQLLIITFTEDPNSSSGVSVNNLTL